MKMRDCSKNMEIIKDRNKQIIIIYRKTMVRAGIISFLILLSGLSASAQGKYKITRSEVSFFSDAPLEDIGGINKETQGIVDFDTRNFLFKVPVKSFVFESTLMEDHFNENYMESEKYPQTIFKGVLQGNYDLKKDGEYPVVAAGDLTLHGVTQKRNIPSSLIVKNGTVSLKSKFNVKLADHKIDIPTLVFEKLAETVEVKIDAALVKL
jgi:polyisoprenoid-binding protein YceI